MTSFLERAEMRGEERGRSAGIAIGEERVKRDLTKKLVAEGWDWGKAASFTGLSL